MGLQLFLDSDSNSICKDLGFLSEENKALCFKGNWEPEEETISDEIQEKVRSCRIISISFSNNSWCQIQGYTVYTSMESITDPHLRFLFRLLAANQSDKRQKQHSKNNVHMPESS